MAIQHLENQPEYSKIGKVGTEEHPTDNSRASNAGVLKILDDSPLKKDPFEHNVTSTLNIVHVPVENYLEPPDEEEYEDNDQEMLLAIQQSLNPEQ